MQPDAIVSANPHPASECRGLYEICIMHRELAGEHPVTLKVFSELYLPFFVHLVDYIRQAVHARFIRPDVDPVVLVGLMLSGLGQTLRYQQLVKRFFQMDFNRSQDRQKLIQMAVAVFAENLVTPPQEQRKPPRRRK